MNLLRIERLAVLWDTWYCVYAGCGASFGSHVELEAHMNSHYS